VSIAVRVAGLRVGIISALLGVGREVGQDFGDDAGGIVGDGGLDPDVGEVCVVDLGPAEDAEVDVVEEAGGRAAWDM
jgi:hypothetical protein